MKVIPSSPEISRARERTTAATSSTVRADESCSVVSTSLKSRGSAPAPVTSGG